MASRKKTAPVPKPAAPAPAAPPVSWLRRYLAPLVGRKIVAVAEVEGFPRLQLDDGTILEVSRDEEGNGPGFIFGLPIPK